MANGYTGYSSESHHFANGLTHALVIHPIAFVLALIAFLAALGAGVVGSMVGGIVAFTAWILTLIVMAVDFALFGALKHQINHDGYGNRARFGSAIWSVLAAFILLLLGSLIVFTTCLSARKLRGHSTKNETTYVDGQVPARKKRFGRF